jgi:broad specificity phosphatase PhoE
MRFIFIRHAQATHNSDAVKRGDIAYFDPLNTDAALDLEGINQAMSAQRHIVCDAIYCSPLQRCYQTLLLVMPSAQELPVRLDDRLMESQGLAVCNKRKEKSTIVTTVPPTWDTTRVAEQNPFETLHEGYSLFVSDMPEFCDRIRAFTEYLVATHSEEQRILLVCHHDWIRTWFQLHKGVTVSPKNCEIFYADLTKQKVD